MSSDQSWLSNSSIFRFNSSAAISKARTISIGVPLRFPMSPVPAAVDNFPNTKSAQVHNGSAGGERLDGRGTGGQTGNRGRRLSLRNQISDESWANRQRRRDPWYSWSPMPPDSKLCTCEHAATWHLQNIGPCIHKTAGDFCVCAHFQPFRKRMPLSGMIPALPMKNIVFTSWSRHT